MQYITINKMQYNTIQYNPLQYNYDTITIRHATQLHMQLPLHLRLQVNTIHYFTLQVQLPLQFKCKYNTVEYNRIEYNTTK